MKARIFFGSLALVASASLLGFTSSPPSSGLTAEEVAKVINEGRDHSQVMDLLHQLTKDVGARSTGSPRLMKAEQWAMNRLRSFGCSNVHLEKWADIPVGWERGPNQVGRMVSPARRDFQFTTNCWTQGTNGPVKGPAIVAPTTMDEFNKVKSKLKGAWVLTDRKATMLVPSAPGPKELKDAIDAAGIAGRVYPSRNELVATHGWWQGKTYDKHPMDVNVSIRKSDWDAVMAHVKKGQKVMLEFNLDNQWIKGPLPQYNVVADIPGSEKPNEYVIVGGHLDSWNSPGSEGACDNGTGVVTAMEAARIILASGVKPKRTIRIVLWTGEEQGCLGAEGYVKTHADEMDRISTVLVDDEGTGYDLGYKCTQEMKDAMEAAISPIQAAFPDMAMKIEVTEKFHQDEGSDHEAYIAKGVPALFTMEGGNVDYGYIWHTQNDRYETAVPKFLVQSATNHAAVALYVADMPELLPRVKR